MKTAILKLESPRKDKSLMLVYLMGFILFDVYSGRSARELSAGHAIRKKAKHRLSKYEEREKEVYTRAREFTFTRTCTCMYEFEKLLTTRCAREYGIVFRAVSTRVEEERVCARQREREREKSCFKKKLRRAAEREKEKKRI